MKYVNNFSTVVSNLANVAVSSDSFTVATPTQTEFDLNERPRTASSILVTKNGLSLVPGQHYQVVDKTLQLTSPANLADLIEVRYFTGTQGPRGEPGVMSGTTDQQIITSNTRSSTSTTSGALIVAGGAGIAGNVNVGSLSVTGASSLSGLLTAQQISEVVNNKTGAAGTITHDFSTGTIFYHTEIAGNFTVNLLNVPTTNNRALAVTLVLAQGSTPYYANGLKINGTDQPFKWPYDIDPLPTSNVLEIQTFTLFRVVTLGK